MTPFRTLIPVLLLCIPALGWPTEGDDALSLYREGERALTREDYFQAVDAFRAALRINPQYVDARMGAAEVLYLLGEYDEAAREIEDSRALAVHRRDFTLLEARIHTGLGRYQAALDAYDGLLASRPHDADALRGLAEVYAIQGQREMARSYYARSLQYAPGDRRILLQLVILHNEAGERNRAEATLEEALNLFPNSLAVRIGAVEHHARYGDWDTSLEHLERAQALVSNLADPRHRSLAILSASLSLRRGRPQVALDALRSIDEPDAPDLLYLSARALRQLGEENDAQLMIQRLLRVRPDDEIARIYGEAPLIRTVGGLEEERRSAAARHLEEGRRFEEAFYYDRALNSYRLARLIDSTNPETWLEYADIIRKKGFPEKYQDTIRAALGELTDQEDRYREIRSELELLEHAGVGGLAEKWGLADPWGNDETAWKVAVHLVPGSQILPFHEGAAEALVLRYAYQLDAHPFIAAAESLHSLGPDPSVADSFSAAFSDSRNRADYFVLLRFEEKERRFAVQADLHLARTGEVLTRFTEVRTGKNRVADALSLVAEATAQAIPQRLAIVKTEGNRVLLNKGRWHGIQEEQELIVLRAGAARTSVLNGGVVFDPPDFLGTLLIIGLSESLSEGTLTFVRDSDFVSPGDEAFILPPPDPADELEALEPVFKTRLLSIP